jgi:hypothetical protein
LSNKNNTTQYQQKNKVWEKKASRAGHANVVGTFALSRLTPQSSFTSDIESSTVSCELFSDTVSSVVYCCSGAGLCYSNFCAPPQLPCIHSRWYDQSFSTPYTLLYSSRYNWLGVSTSSQLFRHFEEERANALQRSCSQYEHQHELLST